MVAPAIPGVEASMSFGGREYTLSGPLHSMTHIRGWEYPCSYVICEVFNPHTELMNEFMNYGVVTIKYGREGVYIGPIDMEIISVENDIEFSMLKVRVTAVEPGFLRLTEKVKIESYPNQSVSSAIGTMAFNAGLQTTGIKETSGQYTFLQTNETDMEFMTKHLIPIATDSSKSAPYLWTIDNNIFHLRPPSLEKEPLFEFLLDPSKDTLVKRFDIVNKGMASDTTYGNEYTTYGYDSIKGELIECCYTPTAANQINMNKFPYKSNFTRKEVLPYEEMWMIDAHNRNNIARAGFVVGAEAVTIGAVQLFFDEILQFTSENFQKQPTEYSGRYYVYSIRNTLKVNLFLSEMNLMSNAFLKAETTKAPQRNRPSSSPNLR